MTETEIDARLKKCSRADLLVIIDRFRRHSLSRANWILEMAFEDVAFEKEQRRLDLADSINQKIRATDEKCAELLRPYEGRQISEVPIEITHQAATLMAESRSLNERWFKLMGVDPF